MAFLSSMNIPLSGMTAQRLRLDIIAQNMANANDVAGNAEDVYKRQVAVFGEDKTFKSCLFHKLNETDDRVHFQRYVKYRGTQVVEVIHDETPAEPVYDPTHPYADENGYIYEANVDDVTEQADSMEASNMYDANLSILETMMKMADKALQIGK